MEKQEKAATLDDVIRYHLNEQRLPYFNWLRQVVTLSVGSLTALVALQGHYIPRQPVWKPALAVCWATLLLSILLGLVALLEEHKGPLRLANQIRNHRDRHGEPLTKIALLRGQLAPRIAGYHRWTARLVLPTLLVALSALCLFATANLLQAET